MKKILVAVLAATTALAGTAAVAQPYGKAYGYHRKHDRDARQWRDSDRDGRPDHREWNRDRDRDGRPDQYDRYDDRYGSRSYGYRDSYRDYGYRNYGSRDYGYYQPRGYWGSHPYYDSYGGWRSGQVYPYYNRSRYVIHDYHRYGLPAPRRGYRYYRDDNGNVVMAAIAGGIIGFVLGNILDDDDRRYRR